MPDGDIIHPALKRRFQNFYGQVCEGHWDASQLGFKGLYPLKGQLKEYGNAPLMLGQAMVQILESVNSVAKQGKPIAFANTIAQINELSKNPKLNGSPRGRDLMVEAAKKVLVDVQHGHFTGDPEFALFRTYINTVYVKDFESMVQETPEHYKSASYSEVRDSIDDIRPYIQRGQDEFARQIIKYKDVNKLKRPRRLKEPALTINDSAW